MAEKKPKQVRPKKGGTVAVDFPEKTFGGYCMKCKETVEATVIKETAVSGKPAVEGKCIQCGEKVFRFIKKKGGAEVAKKAKAKKKPTGLSTKAKAAYAKLERADLLEDCWVGQTKSGKALWWEGNAEKGWTIQHDPIPDTEMAEFKKLIVNSL